MTKLVTVLRAVEGRNPQFVTDLWDHVHEVRENSGCRVAVDVVDMSPAECGWSEVEDYPFADALTEIWFASPAARAEFAARYQPPAGVTAWLYGVEEHVRKDTRTPRWPAPLGRMRMPGVKEIFLLSRPASRSREEFADHWCSVHAALALRAHVGMWKYVQNLVTDSFTRGAPDFDGIAELHYPSVDDARAGRYSSPDDPARIAGDRPNFVGESVWLFAGEYGG